MNLSKVKIKEAMERNGIKTFTELSEKLGITKNQLSVMLSDNYNPLKTRVEDLCILLGVSPLQIMDVSLPTQNDNTIDDKDLIDDYIIIKRGKKNYYVGKRNI